MHHGTAVKNDDVGGAAADVDQRDAQFAFFGKSAASAEASGSSTSSAALTPARSQHFVQVLAVALRRGDDMDTRLQAHPGHPDRIVNAFLLVHGELLRQHMQDLAIERNRDGARRIDYAVDIARPHFTASHRHDAVAVEARVYASRRYPPPRWRSSPRQVFSASVSAPANRVNGRLDIDHHALAQARHGTTP